eukprot:GFKZ01015918.1.p1 GENE.GFKZ01015918.1~~GFKZ01015918.1.p1  ORF type:complete len:1233 (+),score=244.97 GFKZ01015918.1:206-3700(+)
MPTTPLSPDLSSSPPPDTLASALEYIPATSPPPNLPISESMRRLCDLIQANKLAPNSLLHFSYNGRTYTATLLSDGTLSSPAPRPQDARLHPVFHKVYSSPSEFASEMALLALSQDPKMPRPRGRVGVNGWDECLVDGRSLASLRSEMLRERKPTPSNAASPEKVEEKPMGNPEEVGKKENPEAQPVSKETAVDPSKNCADEVTEKETDEVSLGKGVKEKEEVPTAREREESEEAVHVKEGDHEPQNNIQEEPDKVPMGEREKKDEKSEIEASEPQSSSVRTVCDDGEVGRNGTEDASRKDAEEVTETIDVENKKANVEEKASDLGDCIAKDNETQQKEEVKEERTGVVKTEPDNPASDNVETVDDREGKSVVDAKPDGDTGGKEDAPAMRKADEQEVVTETAPRAKDALKAEVEESTNSAPKGEEKKETVGDSPVPMDVAKDLRDAAAERDWKSLSPTKQETRKRKRSEGSDSAPSEANTPTRQGHERSTRRRTEWNRHGRKIEIATGTDLDTDGLDPEAMEAVAIAAQAEKDEANSRGRRTTRLASGTIKQVDYKAAGNAHGLRAFSPSNEDEVENNHSGDSNGEGGRTSRRRTVQNQAMAPQRKSDRVARMRNSQEKDQSLNEEHDHFSAGTGSDARGDGSAGGSQNDFDTGAASGSRMNGTKLEGRDRKRARADARKYRQGSSEAAEFERYDRTYYGTRSSTREDVAAHADGAVDTDEQMDDLGVDHTDYMDEDPEKRIDAHGWTCGDLRSIGEAIVRANSTGDDEILKELKADINWKSEESTSQRVRRYVRRAAANIRDNKIQRFNVSGTVSESELLAYVAMDTWRIQSGGPTPPYPRSQARTLAAAERAEKKKAGLEKVRRKAQREVDDLRGKLDCELDLRRKVAMDAAYVEVLLIEASKRLSAEEMRRKWLERGVERYSMWDERTRNELEKTKILVSHLRGEREGPDESPAAQKRSAAPLSPERKGDENGNGEVGKAARRPGGSVVSNDDVEMTHKEEASPSQRQLEMERLRVLIETKEAEAEMYQRACEKERIRFNTLKDAKSRLESDLYLSRSAAMHAHGGSPAAPGSSHQKGSKDASRKGEGRNGGSGANRNSANAKGKSGNGKQSLGVTPAIAKTKPSNSNNPRAGHGKHGETAKSSKKKSSGKVSSGQGEKH